MKTSIGGDRLGSGNKQDVHLKNFGRSTHDMSYTWRSSMSSGTLVPFINEIGLPGDSFDIDLSCEVLTLPTIGPLFGSYKVQLDVFSCPIRLYNRELAMNKLGIGNDMSAIKFPLIRMTAKDDHTAEDRDNTQVDPSSIWSYLGIRGVGRESIAGTGAELTRDFLAVPFLCYWDIVKQYYANKQEDMGAVIHSGTGQATAWNMYYANYQPTEGGTNTSLLGVTVSVDMNASCRISVSVIGGAGVPAWEEVKLYTPDDGGHTYVLADQFDSYVEAYSPTDNRWTRTWSTYIGPREGVGNWSIEDEAIQGTVAPDGRPQISKFPLKNIDDMRELILTSSVNGAPFVITQNNTAPYGLALKQAQVEGGTIYSKQFSQEGLALKTYQSDLFNNWISTEWIDGDNGINAVTAVSTENGNFTIDALNIANKVYNMLNRIAISGGTYDDWLKAVYTHDRSRSIQNPVYQGSLIKKLAFQEVIATGYAQPAQAIPDPTTPGNPLGTLAGRGQMTGKNKGGRIKVKIDEPSILLALCSITPLIDYSQGNKWHMNLKNMNDLHKPSLDAIGYQDLITDQMAWFDTVVAQDGTLTYSSAGKQPAWMNYMTNVNVVRGDFAKVNNSMFMVLNRRYESGTGGIEDLTTYIDPSKFNHIFADTRLDAQNFWAQIGVKMIARRKMSAKIIPNL